MDTDTVDKEIEQKDGFSGRYKPNKKERDVRRRVYDRYYELKDCDARVEAEAEWELADKEYRMYFDEPEEGDWRANLHLPDAFAAIQVQSQETIDRRSRPALQSVEDSDEPIEDFGNSILNYNMNVTGFDYQYYMGKLSASIRGHAFLRECWRLDKRTVQMPDDVDEDGNIKYVKKEIIDRDDSYTELIPNEYVYPDEKALCDDDMNDYVRREILNIDDFKRIYGSKPGFINQQYVLIGGDTSTRSYFKLPKDINENDVEILHYQNKGSDFYGVVANNVVIYIGSLPSPHKELDIASIKHFEVPDRFYGMGVPKIIHYLSEERRTIRNMNLDRQKIVIGGAFLHNSSFDLDDEDTTLYPGKVITVDTQGQSISNAIQQVNMGDVSGSYFKTEEILREDTIRATGIDDRMQGINMGSTATEAAILKESSLKRVNLVASVQEMTTIFRIGKLKWANIVFFYPIPRVERITQNNEEREQKVYRKITVKGKRFNIVDENGKSSLKMEDVQRATAFELKGQFKKYLNKSYDVIMGAESFTPPSKAIEQTKKTELFSVMSNNPALLANIDVRSAQADILKVNDINPDKWLLDKSPKDMQMLANSENQVMMAGQPLSGTKDAREDHTIVHLLFTKTVEFQQAPEHIVQIIMDHILEEHDKNPATGAAAEMMQSYGLSAGQQSANQQKMAGMNTPFNLSPQTTEPQAQVADLQATNFG